MKERKEGKTRGRREKRMDEWKEKYGERRKEGKERRKLEEKTGRNENT